MNSKKCVFLISALLATSNTNDFAMFLHNYIDFCNLLIFFTNFSHHVQHLKEISIQNTQNVSTDKNNKAGIT